MSTHDRNDESAGFVTFARFVTAGYMSNEKKNTPSRERKAAPTRERKAAPPAARRKKSEEDKERSGPPREKRTASPSTRSRGGDFSPSTRSKRTESGSESTSPIREKRAASPARSRRPEEGSDKRPDSPIRDKRTAAPSARTKRTDEGGDKRPDPTKERKVPFTRGKKTEAGDDKNLYFPREARRYINVYLGLGSNVGNRRAKITSAINMISDQIGKIAKKSHLYETQPWGNTEQDSFLNQVIMINTMLDPRDLLQAITDIEAELGRDRREKEKWGPRTIDIDILFYGKRVVRDKGLEVPHPELHQRAFVLVPLMEIAPDLEHPILKQPIDELYMVCEDQSEVVMLDS